MTDKQIIIDGVDVSGCEFYLPHSEKCGCIVDDNGNNNLLCREYRDCYYKRMSHTGQEKDIYKNENKELYNQLDQLKAENEELKKKLMQKSEVDMFFNTPIEGWSSDPCGVCKYKNCLTEIKEIAESEIDSKEFMAIQCMLNGSVDNKNKVLKQILQKISECEVEDE